MPQAPSLTIVDNASVSHTMSPMGIENGWTVWKQTTPVGDTPMDGFVFYCRVKNPPSNNRDPKASRRAEFKAYWRDTTVVDGVPQVTEQLFAEINYVLPLTATPERCEHFRHLLSAALGQSTQVKETLTKGWPLTA